MALSALIRVVAATSVLQVATASDPYVQYSTTALKALQDSWYNESAGIWVPSMGWWNSANGMTTVADLAKIDGGTRDQAAQIFSDAYSKAPAYNPKNEVSKQATSSNIITTYGTPPGLLEQVLWAGEPAITSGGGNPDGFTNSCYDDNGWWALAWIGAWDLTGRSEYLETAKGIFEQMSGGGPTNCGNGGIIWCTDTGDAPYVNAITNELYMSVAASLANRDSSNGNYLVTAEKQWDWFRNSGMINGDNLINDGLTEDCQNNGDTVWSYNQGVILGALVALNKAKGGGDYLNSAHAIASAAIANLTDGNGIVHEPCEPNCAPDGTQFKGVFMRNLIQLHKADAKDEYQRIITANADSIWANDRNGQNQLSVDWDGPFVDPVNASTHSSAMDALVAAAAL